MFCLLESSASDFDFARSCTESCTYLASLALKNINEAFLARYKNSLKNLASKVCKIIFLQEFHQILQETYLTIFSCKNKLLQENYLANISCKILASIFISCKKSFIFSARLVSLARKILASFG